MNSRERIDGTSGYNGVIIGSRAWTSSRWRVYVTSAGLPHMHAPRACETWIGDCLRQWSACEPLKKSGSLPGSRATSRLVRQHIVTVSGFIDLSTHGEACLTIVALCARSKERAVAQLLAMLMDGLAGTIRSRCGGQKARRRELDA